MPGAPTTRQFNGLNGAEVRTRIVQEIAHALAEETRLGQHLVFPVVTWRWTLDLEVEPSPGVGRDPSRPEPGLHTEVQGRVSVSSPAPTRLIVPGESMDPNRPAWRESALADRRGVRPRSADEVPPRTAFPSDAGGAAVGAGESGGSPPPSLPAAVEDRFARLESLMGQLVDLATAPRAPVGPAEGTGGPLWGEPPPVPPSAGHHPDVLTQTATGLPITGGARPSPGGALAGSFGGGSSVGSVTPAVAPEGLTFGLKHAPLEQGGVGAPDAVRRAAGLPIPQAQPTPDGGIVDLPAGSF